MFPPCSDSRCFGDGITCTDVPVGGTFCCGDGIVDSGESCSNCVADVASEESAAAMTCDDGSDNHCNSVVDCGEFLFRSDPACAGGGCAEVGESCTDDADCCSGDCSGGKPSSRVCLPT